jgi:phosphoribulokinase
LTSLGFPSQAGILQPDLPDAPKPVIIGIVGDSGTGKSTMAFGLAEVLGRERTVVICIDDYHKYARAERAKSGITPHDPACNYLDILEQHVALLRAGAPVLKPVYNHNGGTLEPPEYVEPKEFIILEGGLGYTTPALRDAYDVKLYLEPQEQLRLRWKFQRDTTIGGYTVEQVMASLEALNNDSVRYILPQRAFADMVIGFYPPESDPDEIGARLNVAHILRPTLPHLDLTPVLEIGAEGGFRLELTRDVDGRPVDVLHILGSLDDKRAERMETKLWQLIPTTRNAAALPGAFRNGEQQICRSHPLALSQLLITHYLMNAALGHHVG